MSLAMTFNALVRWRISVTNGRRMSSVLGMSNLPVQVAETDVPQPDVIQHLAFHVAANASGDHPVDQLAIAGLHQLISGEVRKLATLAVGENSQHLLVEFLVDMAIQRSA